MTRSPFEIVENFISPLQCEQLVKALALNKPNTDAMGKPIKYERYVPVELSGNIMSELDALTPLLERRYGGTLNGEPTALFQQYFENPTVPAEGLGCENSKFSRKKWTKIKDVDLVGFIWLKSFHAAVPLDPRIEVYGGKLEFPAFNFSLTPVQGTLVIYPATPHFVTALSHVMVGSLEQIKLNFKLKNWTYDPNAYQGTFKEWFFEM